VAELVVVGAWVDAELAELVTLPEAVEPIGIEWRSEYRENYGKRSRRTAAESSATLYSLKSRSVGKQGRTIGHDATAYCRLECGGGTYALQIRARW
jgi:hypothetical protein